MTKHAPFIMLPHAIYDSPIFAALKPIHIATLLLLIRKHNGHNNGNIPLGTREVEKRCHCGLATASRALKRLQLDGLITATYKGHLVPEIGRPDVATRWRLNFLEEKTLPRSTTDTSGRFSSGTSLAKPDRFSSGTSPRVPLEKQYKDNLTAEAEAEAMPVGDEHVSAAASPRHLTRPRNPVSARANRSLATKPNGSDGAGR
jgi:hypothetical protein